MSAIPFNVPALTGLEGEAFQKLLASGKFCGDGPATKNCNQWLERQHPGTKALLTTSCTHALEMAALLLNIGPSDEVVMPSFTFVSTANAFALRGAKIVFVDVDPVSMNMDARLAVEAFTNKTKAVVPVHYAGTSCDMDFLLKESAARNIAVVEDAAQALMSTYKNRPLGALGEMSAFSFHETKNIHCGEGGALLLRGTSFNERAEIIREKGTNRSRFLRGQVDKYTWVDLGSSYLPSELNAIFLELQLQRAELITADRLKSWELYHQGLGTLEKAGRLTRMGVPADNRHNAHMYWLKTASLDERQGLITHLKDAGISAPFHYVPLHSSPAGVTYGRFHGEDRWTTLAGERLLRLPLWFGMGADKVERVLASIKGFYA